jgi:hypothetical protein
LMISLSSPSADLLLGTWTLQLRLGSAYIRTGIEIVLVMIVIWTIDNTGRSNLSSWWFKMVMLNIIAYLSPIRSVFWLNWLEHTISQGIRSQGSGFKS